MTSMSRPSHKNTSESHRAYLPVPTFGDRPGLSWRGLGGFPGRRLRRIAWDSKDFHSRILVAVKAGRGRRRLDEVCQAKDKKVFLLWADVAGKAWLFHGRPARSPRWVSWTQREGLAPCEEPLRSSADGPDSARTKDIPLFLCTKYVTCHACRCCVYREQRI